MCFNNGILFKKNMLNHYIKGFIHSLFGGLFFESPHKTLNLQKIAGTIFLIFNYLNFYSMSKAKQGDTVKVHYTGKLKDGSVFDSSANREPLEFTLGGGNMIPGFEQAVLGMESGQTKVAEIPSDQAYGEKREDMIISVPRENVPGDISPEVGQQLAVQQEGGQQVPVTVTEVTEEKVVLDANHPLAGKDLVFEIEVLAVS